VVKHYFNLRHQGNPPIWLLPSAALATVAVVILSGPWMRETTVSAQMVSDNQAMSIVQRHCTSCHATMPTQPGFSAPPKGVVLETVAHLQKYATQVQAQAGKPDWDDPGRAKSIGWMASTTSLMVKFQFLK
ncbi:MAG: hypothetical protein ACPHP9_10830, partial [bacterium]